MKKYLSVFRIRFIAALQYRTAAVAGLITQFAWAFMEILAFTAFYRANPAAFPMEFSQMVSYIWMQQAFASLFMLMFGDNQFSAIIESGDIAYELARPIDLYNRWFFQSTSNRLARAMLRCWPILFVAFIMPDPYRLVLPSSIINLLLFLLSATLSMVVVVAFSMLMDISVFYTLSSRGTRLVLGQIADFFAGAIIPLPFFPASIRNVVELLPFAAMQNMPLRIYSGNITGMYALKGIALQIFWLIVLWFLGRLVISSALKKVIVQGG